MKKQKLNNAGFSLVELIIAVAILGVVVAPFLHSFVTTAKANSKAKRTLKATTICQDIMEGIYSQDIEEISKQFNYPTDDNFLVYNKDKKGTVKELVNVAGAGSFELGDAIKWDASLGTNAQDSVTSSIYTEDAANFEFLGQDSGKYYFALDDLQEDTTKYDVLVKMNSNAYTTSGMGAEGHNISYNSEELLMMPIVDTTKDALCIEPLDYLNDAFSSLVLDVDNNDSRKNLYRVITINVEEVYGSDNKYRTNVTATYDYYTSATATTPIQKGGGVPVFSGKSHTLAEGTDLRNVFLYYNPLYFGMGKANHDVIVLNNKNSVEFNLYMVKQEQAYNIEGSPALNAISDEEYSMAFFINESTAVTNPNKCKAKIYSNLDINLYKLNRYLDPTVLPSAKPTSVQVGSTSNVQKYFGKTYIKGTDLTPSMYGASRTISEFGDCWNSIVYKDTHERMYDVTISVYENDAFDYLDDDDELSKRFITSMTGYKLD